MSVASFAAHVSDMNQVVFSRSFKTERPQSDRMIGSSFKFQQVLKQVETVAPTSSAVLINGETGTGKELIARAIHDLSPRRDQPFVKLNCAAIPTGLLESELFGHERGAYTGAVAPSIGRLQLAHGGTLFLDEIGDLPLELQPKLLRVLQEQEFERLGSTRTIRVNVRVIAATNQDLAAMVRDKQFRADLYYRLNVFPIKLPPLRERRDDIPLLVQHFVHKFAAQMNKRVENIPDEVNEVLKLHDWPGNVRELQNFIERAVIMTQGGALRPPLEELRQLASVTTPTTFCTLAEAERNYILDALRQSRWIVGGQTGAAARLGLSRTTLIYRMKKHGIKQGQLAAVC
ncbi:MAG TPA: sigma 54-interacting transcriptional regulator [Pyrinomonadaceae bacterium]|nr:sigma 54-interacting transcriptional regulator [Pyrinomonadaceae bacterium]